MELKEKIKKEIDLLPEEYLAQIAEYLEHVKKTTVKKRKIETMSLKGRYDDIDVRTLAYE